MRLAILSDTHDRHDSVAEALRLLERESVDLLIHCGDITEVETVSLFQGTSSHFVLGNCDSDRHPLKAAIEEIGGTLHEPFGELELGGKRIAWIHSHDARLMFELEHAEKYDYLFYGHTHQAEEHHTGRTRVVNPGALHRARPRSFAILEVESDSLRRIEL